MARTVAAVADLRSRQLAPSDDRDALQWTDDMTDALFELRYVRMLSTNRSEQVSDRLELQLTLRTVIRVLPCSYNDPLASAFADPNKRKDVREAWRSIAGRLSHKTGAIVSAEQCRNQVRAVRR